MLGSELWANGNLAGAPECQALRATSAARFLINATVCPCSGLCCMATVPSPHPDRDHWTTSQTRLALLPRNRPAFPYCLAAAAVAACLLTSAALPSLPSLPRPTCPLDPPDTSSSCSSMLLVKS